MRRGLAESREQAKELIAVGHVLVSGAIADKPARQVDASEPIELLARPRFVSRGGEKLDAALERFDLDVAGTHALDAGSSTGGFTDCLLQRGAARVTAVDVGRHQLHERLRADGRVDVHEQTHIRDFQPADGKRFPLVVADLSFISLRTVAPDLARLAAPDADLVLLIKPQFEVGRVEAAKGKGVVRDPAAWRQALIDVVSALQGLGAAMMGAMVSPLKGADGNVEFLGWFRMGAVAAPVDLDAVVAEAEAR